MGQMRSYLFQGNLSVWLNRQWRVAMTGFCFVIFGLGGLLLSLVWFNLLLLVQRDRLKRRQIARRSIAICFRFFLAVARFVKVLDYQVTGLETLQQDKGCLIVANHPTLLDYVILASVLPYSDCVVKSKLLHNPFVSGVIKAADYLVNDERIDVLMEVCQQRLNDGEVILIFPEGTRTRADLPVKLQRGAANIAVRCQSDLRVVQICCQPPVVTKDSKWYQVPPTKPVFSVHVKEMIRVEHFLTETLGLQTLPTVAARRLTEYLTVVLASYKTCTFGNNDGKVDDRN